LSSWDRNPVGFDTHFANIVNGEVLVLAYVLLPEAFNVIDPIEGPDLKTFILHVACFRGQSPRLVWDPRRPASEHQSR
jgi:hypothetical protein